jgi:hypothetical protein
VIEIRHQEVQGQVWTIVSFRQACLTDHL